MKKPLLFICCAMLIACSKAPVVKQQQLEPATAPSDALAQKNLADQYANGTGVPKDYAKAAELYEKAAEQGNADAQDKLGDRYTTGTGVPKDDVKAAEWYQKAADQGDVDAEFSLANMYADGRGVPKDDAKAASWFAKATAAQEAADAQSGSQKQSESR